MTQGQKNSMAVAKFMLELLGVEPCEYAGLSYEDLLRKAGLRP